MNAQPSKSYVNILHSPFQLLKYYAIVPDNVYTKKQIECSLNTIIKIPFYYTSEIYLVVVQ